MLEGQQCLLWSDVYLLPVWEQLPTCSSPPDAKPSLFPRRDAVVGLAGCSWSTLCFCRSRCHLGFEWLRGVFAGYFLSTLSKLIVQYVKILSKSKSEFQQKQFEMSCMVGCVLLEWLELLTDAWKGVAEQTALINRICCNFRNGLACK